MKKRVFFFFLILAIFFIFWIFFIEPYSIKVEKLELKIKNLPSSFEKIKIAHLTDLHSKKFGFREKKVIEILEKLKPDYIFVTGDIVDWQTKDLLAIKNFWQKISEKFYQKIFGVYGNHEHRNPRFKKLDNLFSESKIKILNNQSLILKKDGDFIYLIGVDDPHLGFDNLEKAMKEVKNEAPKILLAHSPEIFRKIKEKNIKVDLILVGHTHGCQINLPILDNFLLPLKYDKIYKRGLFKEDSIYLYVNRGIGTTFLPIRLNSFPEIALITLKSSL
jgi:predicted MPP superfamily phosphohydrolase